MKFLKTLFVSSLLTALLIIISAYVFIKYGAYNSIFYNINVIIVCICVFFGLSFYSSHLHSNHIIKNVILGGLIGLLATSGYAIWFYYYTSIYNPELMYSSLNTIKIQNELKAEGLDDVQIRRTIKNMTEVVSVKFINSVVIISYTFISIMISILVAFFLKRKLTKSRVNK